jgi:nucleoside-diphosphate-sugar epimerase
MAASSIAGRKVLVTGAAGFLGSHLCERLALSGAETHAVSRSARTDATGRLRWWQADLEDLDAARDLVARVKPDALFHLGGLADGARDAALLVPTFRSLLATTVHLIQAVNEAGAGRLILIGSLEEPRADEIAASPYAVAKSAATSYARMAHRAFGTPVVVVRTYMAFGPGQDRAKIIPYTITSLLRGVAPNIANPARRLDWIYVDDVVEGLIRAAVAPGLGGETLELGRGTAVSIRQVVETLVEMIAPHVAPVFPAAASRSAEPVHTADLAPALARIGWRPRISLESGLALTTEWFRRRQE